MTKLKYKYAIGCIVQWYEVEMYEEYIQSIVNSLSEVENKENVVVDLCFYLSNNLEEIDESQMTIHRILNRFRATEHLLIENNINCKVNYYNEDEIYTIANYRRDFNDKYCTEVDVLMWGESDSLIPHSNFQILDMLHEHNINNNIFKYLSFFGTCKMWDDSWKSIEHNDFTDKEFTEGDTENEWSVRYVTSLDEMNNRNNKVNDLDVRMVNPYKFNGCGLVISSEIVKSGVNIPKSLLLVHEDTAFQNSLIRMFGGGIPQFVIKNVLLVHNRNHPKKRMYVFGEDLNEKDAKIKRKSNAWYQKVWELDHNHANNMFNQTNSYTWKDVFDE